MKPSFKLYDMNFIAVDTPVNGKPKHDTYRINQVLESYRPKNGHNKAVVTRPLTPDEKDFIKAKFLKWKGIIKEDAALRIKKEIPDVTIFQITGAIVNLHRQVQMGVIQIKDPLKYHQKMQARRKEWASWNSPKYEALRDKINGTGAPTNVAFAYPSMV